MTNNDPLQTFLHSKQVSWAAFSRDESRVLTCSFDNTVKLWDITKPNPVMTFDHDSAVSGAVFTRDESRLLTWSQDHTAKLWNIPRPEDDLTPDKRILEFEVRSATRLDASGQVQPLRFSHMLDKRDELDKARKAPSATAASNQGSP